MLRKTPKDKKTGLPKTEPLQKSIEDKMKQSKESSEQNKKKKNLQDILIKTFLLLKKALVLNQHSL